jgi:hypothetical protein
VAGPGYATHRLCGEWTLRVVGVRSSLRRYRSAWNASGLMTEGRVVVRAAYSTPTGLSSYPIRMETVGCDVPKKGDKAAQRQNLRG